LAIRSINPATGELMVEFRPEPAEDIERRIAAAAQAFEQHRSTTFAARAKKMLRAADELDAGKLEFARCMTEEMGKPI
jgi:succinate-semialdehyde dehydrogenase/glutarate-semialdehyde dehydrogenase